MNERLRTLSPRRCRHAGLRSDTLTPQNLTKYREQLNPLGVRLVAAEAALHKAWQQAKAHPMRGRS